MRSRFPHAQQNKKAIVLAGPPGAGKSTSLTKTLGDTQNEYVHVNADDFKELLLRESLRDGSYETVIVPSEIKDLAAQGEQFFPLELASLVHAESGQIALSLRKKCLANGDNLILDTVLSSESSALNVGERLQSFGYEVSVIDVEVPYEVSAASIAARWEESYKQAVEHGQVDENHLGGRWVPSEYAKDVFDGPEEGVSKSRAAAGRLARECDAVTEFRVFDNAQRDMKLIVHQQRSSVGAPLEHVKDIQAVKAQQFARSQFPGPPRPSAERGHAQTDKPANRDNSMKRTQNRNFGR